MGKSLPLQRNLRTALKGQLISKCSFGVKTSSKKPTKFFPGFCPKIFCTFLGASWKLFWASCRLSYLWYYLLSPQEAKNASRKPPGSCKKIQGLNQEIISLVFWKKLSFHKDIIKLTDLYDPPICCNKHAIIPKCYNS
jgi:hypothetical protein